MGAPKSLTLGAEVDGLRGLARPSPDKFLKFIGLVWHFLGSAHIPWAWWLAAAGQAVFMLQFRRPLFQLLQHVWSVALGEFPGVRGLRAGREGLLGVVLALPFVFMDFRLKVSNSITCTDASEQGGAVCVARELTTQGLETLLKVLSPIVGLFAGRLVLVEVCAGIGGARRALEMLGVTPVLYYLDGLWNYNIYRRYSTYKWPVTQL